MANTIWDGSDGVLNTVGNWSFGLPVAGSKMIFASSQTGSVTSQANAFTSLTMGEVLVQEGYSGDLGSSGDPLELSCGLFTFRGSGKLFLNNGDTGDITDLVIDTPGGSAVIGASQSAIDRIIILRGTRNTLLSTLTGTTDLFVHAGASVDIQGSNSIANIYAAPGAEITSTIPLVNVQLMGASLTQWTGSSNGLTGVLAIGNAGKCIWVSSATVAEAIIFPGGILDYEKNSNPVTLTTARVFPQGTIKRAGIELTITNGGALSGDNVDLRG